MRARIGNRSVALVFVLLAVGCGGGGATASDGSDPGDAFMPDGGIPADGGGDSVADAGTTDASEPAGACNPLAAEWDCALPFPSDWFLADDPSLPSGRRVSIPPRALLRDQDGRPVDSFVLHPADGWSVGTQILALFPFHVDGSNLMDIAKDVGLTLGAGGPTVVLDSETGKPVLHMAELDPRPEDPRRRALVIRPLERLEHRRRYIVGIRDLRDTGGAPLPAPAGFAAIRDGTAGADQVLAALAERYGREVFPALDAVGFGRGQLLLAWDFTTESEENVTRDMISVRDDLLLRLAAAPPVVDVVEVKDGADEHIFRIIEATVRVPLYVDSAEPGAMLRRGPDGHVEALGEADVPFTVVVPRSVATRDAGAPPARLLQFGHGFFGNRHEIVDNFVFEFADAYGFVVVAADWWGMSDEDRWIVMADLTGDPANTLRFSDRVHQGMANFVALAAAAAGPLSSIPELQFGGGPAYDPSAVYFYGISMGGILGGTYAALSPHVERAVLGVGGADFSLMMFRARPFTPFLILIDSVFPDPLDQQKLTAAIQSSFDRIDPLTYAPRVARDPYPGSPADRRILIQTGIGDAQVPNISSHLHARALDAIHLQPAPRSIPAIATAESPVDGSAIVEFDFGVDPLPGMTATPPGEDNEAHEGVRRTTAGMNQIDAFLRPAGAIIHTCAGACDPE
ncbi:MAG: hypothetical protein HY897_10600 [Deltaproteobacteria bacterium]|nr:hypothetical protein [Deltaproteobacteria bacterium]